jgi:hypothetical protein
MRLTFQGAARALFLAAALASSTAIVGGCREGSNNAVPANITADDKQMVLHAVHVYPTQNASDYNAAIMVVDLTYTNTDPIPQIIQPNKFVLIDQQTNAQYHALDGGDIHVPQPAVNTQLDPNKAIDLSLGFRIPPNLLAAHLSYSP